MRVHKAFIFILAFRFASSQNERDRTKDYVKRRHGEPNKFIFLSKMGFLGSQARNEKKESIDF